VTNNVVYIYDRNKTNPIFPYYSILWKRPQGISIHPFRWK